MEKKKGCVYFFKHVGLSPIKIGFSTKDTPAKRFEQFKTYSPYGAEIVAFVNCENPKELETELHLTYAHKRLVGEWFDISEAEITLFATFYPDHKDLLRNDDYLEEWTLKHNRLKNVSALDTISFNEPDRDDFEILSASEISTRINVDKMIISSFIRKNNISSSTFRIGKIVKNGYKVWFL